MNVDPRDIHPIYNGALVIRTYSILLRCRNGLTSHRGTSTTETIRARHLYVIVIVFIIDATLVKPTYVSNANRAITNCK